MSNVAVEKHKLDVLATAISNKSGVPLTLTLTEMVDAVDSIQTGGSGSGYVWQDAQGYVHLSDEEETHVEVEALSVTQNGTYTAQTGHAYSPVTVNVSSGLTNVVTGTFTLNSTSAGTAVDISIPYTGTGYPVILVIVVDGGVDGNADYAQLIDRYSVAMRCYTKEYFSQAPTYASSGNENIYRLQYSQKSSDTSPTTYGGSTTVSYLTHSVDAVSSSTNSVRIKSPTTMSVFAKQTSYGFSTGITYRYLILYSS